MSTPVTRSARVPQAKVKRPTPQPKSKTCENVLVVFARLVINSQKRKTSLSPVSINSRKSQRPPRLSGCVKMAHRGSSFPSTSHVSVKRRKSDFILVPMFQITERRPSLLRQGAEKEPGFDCTFARCGGSFVLMVLMHRRSSPGADSGSGMTLPSWLKVLACFRYDWCRRGHRRSLPHAAVQ